jgi:hypothetical protein
LHLLYNTAQVAAFQPEQIGSPQFLDFPDDRQRKFSFDDQFHVELSGILINFNATNVKSNLLRLTRED